MAIGGFSNVKLVEYTGRLFPQGKASISAELVGIFERLGISPESWHNGMDELRGQRLLGGFFAASRVKLREVAKHLGVRHLVNLIGLPGMTTNCGITPTRRRWRTTACRNWTKVVTGIFSIPMHGLTSHTNPPSVTKLNDKGD